MAESSSGIGHDIGQNAGFWRVVACDPSSNDVMRPLKEWSQEGSFDTLQKCASYRERQADELIKKMETVPEGSPDYKIYDPAVTRHLLGRCILGESSEIRRHRALANF